MVSIIDRFRGDNVPAPAPAEPEPEETFAEMTLQEHLEELRTRLVRSALAVIAGSVVGLIFSFRIIKFMERRSHLSELYAISPTESFNTFLKVGLYVGIAIAMPVLIYQLIGFLAPGLTRKEKKVLYRFLPLVVIMFALGVVFAFMIVVPRALDWLSHFGSGTITSQLRAEEVISFYMTLMLWIGVVFELPVVMFLLSKLGIVSHGLFSRLRRYMLVLVMIAAAMITPTPDPFNMFLVAVPMYALYEFGILLARFA
jgi:sec-independent protein translocase protein TatC